jgi:hypothetical protein
MAMSEEERRNFARIGGWRQFRKNQPRLIPNGSHVHVLYSGETVVCGYVVDEINVRLDGPHVGRYLIYTADLQLWEANADLVADMGDEPLSFDVVVPASERCGACRRPWWRDHHENCPWWPMMRALGYIP